MRGRAGDNNLAFLRRTAGIGNRLGRGRGAAAGRRAGTGSAGG